MDGSLKPAAPALAADADALSRMRAAVAGRAVWLAASTHPQDEELVLAAQRARLAADPAALLIVAPRDPTRGADIARACERAGLTAQLRSDRAIPDPATRVYVADSFGEMGLWYRLVPAAFIGGTTGPVEGHNPWEAAQLGAAILHGPRVANFAADFAALHAADAAREVATPDTLAAALTDPGTAAMAGRARTLADHGMDRIDDLCRCLAQILPQPDDTP